MTISGGYRHQDYPVAVNDTFVKRVQSVDLTKNTPMILHYEMGNEEPAGVSDDTDTYTGRITWLPIDNQLEALFLGLDDITNTSPKGLLDYISADGVTVATPKDSILGARLVTLDYALRVGGNFTGTATFEGSAHDSGVAITVTNPTGRGAYRAPDLIVKVDNTQVARAQGFTLRAGLRIDRLMELGSETPVSIDLSTPQVTVGIDWVESDSIAGNSELTIDSPADIVIQIGSQSGGKRLTVKNAVCTGVGPRGVVNGYATRRYDYISKGDTTYGGLMIDKIP